MCQLLCIYNFYAVEDLWTQFVMFANRLPLLRRCRSVWKTQQIQKSIFDFVNDFKKYMFESMNRFLSSKVCVQHVCTCLALSVSTSRQTCLSIHLSKLPCSFRYPFLPSSFQSIIASVHQLRPNYSRVLL